MLIISFHGTILSPPFLFIALALWWSPKGKQTCNLSIVRKPVGGKSNLLMLSGRRHLNLFHDQTLKSSVGRHSILCTNRQTPFSGIRHILSWRPPNTFIVSGGRKILNKKHPPYNFMWRLPDSFEWRPPNTSKWVTLNKSPLTQTAFRSIDHHSIHCKLIYHKTRSPTKNYSLTLPPPGSVSPIDEPH